MSNFCVTDEITLPGSLLRLSEHLGSSSYQASHWAWLELSGGVMSHYLMDQQHRFDSLLSWFYNDLRFCQRQNYFGAEAADLALTLTSKQGNSTTLGCLLMLLCQKLDLDASLLFLPGNAILRVKLNNKVHFINPLSGKAVDRKYMHSLVRGELGNHAKLSAKYFKPVKAKDLMSRQLHELKAGSIVSQKFEQALECCNLLLKWHPDDVQLNRERAFVAEQLGCIKMAAEDLQHFVENSPHDPLIELVKIQIKELNQHAETYH
ncbi:hypothetical protein D5018_08115 [Parashewanella curva]|uniref:Protein SirB1 N-terminal domain-containing protein n=1 Tax=Parashewanella curva TaxID=2338552 RepID=A0A3L8PZL1_9GAMM|nr:tetratricopeptide repeat protein [Parashewanella curva]RLV60219.1 hypothetical protein D5018_08115 [Parashewanella curva]